MRKICAFGTLLLTSAWFYACGSYPKPQDAYENAPDLLSDMVALRKKTSSFRISGKVDHFGEEHRIQGKLFLFSKLPQKLRIDLLSPFGSTLSVLTVNDGNFFLSDHKKGRYMKGPAEPCNIARLVRIPLPPEDVIRILIGDTPLIEGKSKVEWDTQGFYRVKIEGDDKTQILEIDPDKETLKLLRSTLKDSRGILFDIRFQRWRTAMDISVPREIRVKMPREKADLLLRYDDDGVETNIELPSDAWTHNFPEGVKVEHATCE